MRSAFFIGGTMDRSVATRTGDKGDTSLMFGNRVDKDDLRVEVFGTIDELNAALGMARSHCEYGFIRDLILHLQQETFVVGGELATPPEKLPQLSKRVEFDMVAVLDDYVATIEEKHTYSQDWAMPGDHPSPAALDFARTVCRRCERMVVHLYKIVPESKNPVLLQYLNRLSDLLWLMARWEEREHNVKLTSVRDFLDDKGLSLKKKN